MNSGRLDGVSGDPITLNPNSTHELTRAKETDTGIANSMEESALDGQSADSPSVADIHQTGSSEVETTSSASDNEKGLSKHNATDEMLSQSEVKNLRNVDDLYETANLHRQAEDFEKAIEDYVEIIKLEPRFASAFYERGLCYLELSKDRLALEENFSDALRLGLEDFAKAISIDLKYWFSFRKEPFYLGLGNRQMAVDSFIKRKSDSYTSLSQTDLAFDESKTDNPKEENALNPTSYEATFAQSSFDSSSDHDTHGNPEYSEGYLENVNGESEKLVPEDVFLNPVEGREHKTVASSSITPQKDELSNLVDSKVGALYKRGKLNRELGEQSNALDDYTAAITLSPGFAAAIYERALCYVSLEKDELALEDFSNAIALEPVYWSSLRKEQFYRDLGVRRADVEKYIALRCSTYDNVPGNPEFTDVMESHDIFEMDQDERSTTSPRILRWASGFTKLFRKTNL